MIKYVSVWWLKVHKQLDIKMKMESFKHENVMENGVIPYGGAVYTEKRISFSFPSETGGCGMSNCNCSPGHWCSIGLDRTDDGVVEGIEFKFKSQSELLEFINKMKKAIRKYEDDGCLYD